MRSNNEAPPPVEFERIVPRRPDGPGVAGAPGASAPDAAARVSTTSLLIAVGALVVLAAVVFLLLPRLLTGSSPDSTVRAPTQVPPTPAADAAATTSTPAPPAPAWDDAALLEARAQAQSARAQFEEQLATLNTRGVQTWGAGPLARSQAQAATGASAFAAKDFPAARTAYQAAATGTAALIAEIPSRLAEALAAGAAALEAADKDAAQKSFDLAAVLDPGNAQARRGLERVASLDAVRVQIDSARRLEQAGDVVGARAAWQQALALDRDTQSARDALARLDAQAGEAEFRRVLGEALDALDRGQYDLAEKHLARARALRGSDAGVRQAAARLADARRTQKLASLEREGASRVASEDWVAAVASYRAALQIDGSVAFARDGLARAEPRLALAQRLQDFIDRPERLSAAGVAADAERSLQQARAIADPGPRLGEQISALEKAVAGASTPVAVRLQSDGKTDVTVYKVGAVGRFTTHDMQLKPGRYVAVGSRSGFRDVRQEFDVAPGAKTLSVEVRCEEAL